MFEKIIPENISDNQEKDTGLALSFLFILIGYFSSNIVYYKIAGPIILLTMLVPKMFRPVAYIWYSIANILGFFISKIVLSIIYFLFIIPFGLTRKILGKDNLKLREFKADGESVFVDRNHIFSKEDIIKPF